MKKNLSLVLVLVICLSLCACGKSQTPQNNTPMVETSAPEAVEVKQNTADEADENRIEFSEPVLVIEDAKMKVELLNFFQDVNSASGNGTKPEKLMTVKFYNKTDHPITFAFQQLHMENDGVYCIYMSGVPEILSQGSTICQFKIQTGSKDPLDSMEQLRQLEGTMYVIEDDAAGKRTSYTVPISFPDAFSGKVETFAEDAQIEEPARELTLGETAKTDMAEFTLMNVEFRKGIYTGTEAELVSGNGDVYTPDPGMVFVKPQFTLRNLSKTSYDIHKSVSIAVDYSDGFLYTMDDHNCYITHDGGMWTRYAGGGGKGQIPTLSPLLTGEYKYFIPAVDLIETDTESPLRLIVYLPSQKGTEEFIYRIR